MVGSPDIIAVIVKALQKYKPVSVVVDPVMISTSGSHLADDETIKSIRQNLLPMATVLTPNIPEAEVLLGRDYGGDMQLLSELLLKFEPRGVLLKGGHLSGAESVDIYSDRDGAVVLSEDRVETENTHGTGCTLASALAVYLAKGLPPAEAARAAKKYVTGALKYADELNVGKGAGPLNHFFAHWGRPSD